MRDLIIRLERVLYLNQYPRCKYFEECIEIVRFLVTVEFGFCLMTVALSNWRNPKNVFLEAVSDEKLRSEIVFLLSSSGSQRVRFSTFFCTHTVNDISSRSVIGLKDSDSLYIRNRKTHFRIRSISALQNLRVAFKRLFIIAKTQKFSWSCSFMAPTCFLLTDHREHITMLWRDAAVESHTTFKRWWWFLHSNRYENQSFFENLKKKLRKFRNPF